MIVTSSGISGTVAENARASLDAQVAQLQAEGILEPGKSSHEKLKWTPETIAAAQEFKMVSFDVSIARPGNGI
jgi:hypothetical protein